MEIISLLEKLNITPKNKMLYYEALTHATFANENKGLDDYQRLEFVGDALLDQATAIKIFNTFPEMNEGDMSIIRSNAVNSNQLASFSRKIGLREAVRFGGGIKDLIDNTKILADIFESFTAAIFLDLGEKKMYDFLGPTVFKFIEESKGKNLKNPKTLLQEFLQAESRETIIYETTPFGDGFESRVFHEKTIYGIGKGVTKRAAEVEAAKNALTKVKR